MFCYYEQSTNKRIPYPTFCSGSRDENGNPPEDMCKSCDSTQKCKYWIYKQGQQSIISKLVEVDLDEMQTLYEEYRAGWKGVDKDSEPMYLEQFIQQQMNLSNKSNSSQEVTNGKQL